MLLHPRPDVLYEIYLGRGWKYSSNASVGVDLLNEHFDFATEVDFFGNHGDYHVVYEKLRTERPELPNQQGVLYDEDRYNKQTLYEAWDAPRLKQVVGRNCAINIEYNDSHFGGYTISVHRHSATFESLTANEELTSGLELVEKYVFSSTTTPGESVGQENLKATNEQEVFTMKGPTANGEDSLFFRGYHRYYDGISSTEGVGDRVGTYNWEFIYEEGSEKFKKTVEIVVDSNDDEELEATVEEFLDAQEFSSTTSTSWNPLTYKAATNWVTMKSGQTITGTATLGGEDDPAFRDGRLAKSIDIDYGQIQPSSQTVYFNNGLLQTHSQSSWRTDGSIENGVYRQRKQYGSN